MGCAFEERPQTVSVARRGSTRTCPNSNSRVQVVGMEYAAVSMNPNAGEPQMQVLQDDALSLYCDTEPLSVHTARFWGQPCIVERTTEPWCP